MLDYITIIFEVDLNYIFAIMNMILIRKAKANDMVSVLDLIKELAEFEREPKSVILNVSDLINDGFCNNPKFRCIVAEIKNEVVGMALFYDRYSTWKGRTLHLEDLIVKKAFRGKGVGKKLYKKFIKIAKEEEVMRAEWVALDWNVNAIKFYKNSGAKVLSDWKTIQIDKKSIKNYLIKK
ncbi:MAG: N-acetyltransferase family protein [Flavobacteriaceae bacterium]